MFVVASLSVYILLRRYGDLEQEAQELGVAKEPEVINLLNKLYPFAIDDIKTLPFVQVCSMVLQRYRLRHL